MFNKSIRLLSKFGIIIVIVGAASTSFIAWNSYNSPVSANSYRLEKDYIVAANNTINKNTPSYPSKNIKTENAEKLFVLDTKEEGINDTAATQLPNTTPTLEGQENLKKSINATTTEPNIEENDSIKTITEEFEENHNHEREEHDHSEIEIAYSPHTIITTNTNLIPTNISSLEQENNELIGFEQTDINLNKPLELRGSMTLTLPEKVNPKILDHIVIEPQADLDITVSGQEAHVRLRGLERDQNYTIGIKTEPVCTFEQSLCSNNNLEWGFKTTFKSSVREDILLGNSVENREIWGYKFGRCRSGNCTKIMLTGAVHGSEYRSGDLTQLIEYITNNQHEISGQDKELFIVPVANPDGKERNQRFNAREVNLNRNFDVNWRGCSECGLSAESEPETRIIKEATISFGPKYLISYHAQWPPYGIIFRGNDNNPETVQFANYVADRTGYPVGYFPGFENVPGDQTVWAEEIGIVSLIIEATYVKNTDWDRNFNLYLNLLREL